MKNALNNPHFKKIWVKVMMNRNPEAKTLEEALNIIITPITLEDILPFLFCYSIWVDAERNIVKMQSSYDCGLTECYIDWQLTKPLDEQTPETWEKIAKVILSNN